jgi:hypothetical protein
MNALDELLATKADDITSVDMHVETFERFSGIKPPRGTLYVKLRKVRNERLYVKGKRVGPFSWKHTFVMPELSP